MHLPLFPFLLVFVHFFLLSMFGKSCAVLISYEMVKLRFSDDIGGKFLLRSYVVVLLVNIAA